MGDPQIENDTIYIPLIYGKYSFPLTITTDATFSKKYERVIGDYNNFKFEYDQTGELRVNGSLNAAYFYVIAENGYPKKWYVSMKNVLDYDNASILSMAIDENKKPNMLFCPRGIVNQIDTMVDLYYI